MIEVKQLSDAELDGIMLVHAHAGNEDDCYCRQILIEQARRAKERQGLRSVASILEDSLRRQGMTVCPVCHHPCKFWELEMAGQCLDCDKIHDDTVRAAQAEIRDAQGDI